MSDRLWVFAYGSLIWSPGFEPEEQMTAVLQGFARRFCLCSISYRGTHDKPGLVLALDQNQQAECHGVALCVRAGEEDQVLASLRARELARPAYLERFEHIRLQDGRHQRAVTYVVNPANEHYINVSPTRQAQIIASAHGVQGPNCDYLWNTAEHLRKHGISDPDLDALSHRVHRLIAEQTQ